MHSLQKALLISWSANEWINQIGSIAFHLFKRQRIIRDSILQQLVYSTVGASMLLKGRLTPHRCDLLGMYSTPVRVWFSVPSYVGFLSYEFYSFCFRTKIFCLSESSLSVTLTTNTHNFAFLLIQGSDVTVSDIAILVQRYTSIYSMLQYIDMLVTTIHFSHTNHIGRNIFDHQCGSLFC